MSLTVSSVTANRYAHALSGAASAPTSTKKTNSLFDQTDITGAAAATPSQFAQTIKSLNQPEGIKSLGADAVFAALDQSKAGSVDKKKFSSGMTKLLSVLNTQAMPTTVSSAASAGSAQSASSGMKL